MAFKFEKDESVAKAIPRLVCERVDDALECVQDCSHAEAIHCARKDIKKIRAVLRLVRASIPQKELRSIARPLRHAAAVMAGPRDAHVKAQAVASLVKHFKGKIASGAFRHVRARLHEEDRRQISEFKKQRSQKNVIHCLRHVRKQIQNIELSESGWGAIAPGLRRTYRDGRKAFSFAQKSGRAEDFHEWRKHAKDLWYHVDLLNSTWPEQLDAVENELENMGESLGDDHDLFVLSEYLEEMAEDLPQTETTRLQGMIMERQRKLRYCALALGKRFYTEKPGKFCDRLGQYWHAWRRERKTNESLSPA